MVKPQFEVGRERVGAGGVVRDPELRAEAVLDGGRRGGASWAGRRRRGGEPAARARRATSSTSCGCAGAHRADPTDRVDAVVEAGAPIRRAQVERVDRSEPGPLLLVAHTGREDAHASDARTVAADLIAAGFAVRVLADEAARPGPARRRCRSTGPSAGRGRRDGDRARRRRHDAARRRAGPARRGAAAGRQPRPGRVPRRGRDDDLDKAVRRRGRRHVHRRGADDPRRLGRADGEVIAEPLGAQRGQRREGRPGADAGGASSRSTAARCRATAATAWSAPRRPARRRTPSPRAARWCGRRSRRC